MLKKLNEKKNNKGFSLVELIVVILIMAVLAVALAPQVMKWVGNSRVAADVQAYDGLVSNCQLALTDSTAYNEVHTVAAAGTPAVKYKLTIGTSGTTLKDNAASPADASGTEFGKALTAVDPKWNSLKRQNNASGASDYIIEIYDDGTVRSTANKPDGSTVK